MIYFGSTSGGKKSRTNYIDESIINWLSYYTVFINRLIAGENIFNEVSISFLIFIRIGIELFAGTVGVIRIVRIRFLLALGSLERLGKQRGTLPVTGENARLVICFTDFIQINNYNHILSLSIHTHQ
jgi:hypothetical protein